MTGLKGFLKSQALVFASLFVATFIGFGIFYSISKNSGTETQAICQGICVSLYENRAAPDTVTVPVGTHVQFNSKDGKSHNLSLGEGGEEHEHNGKFYSGEFQADEGWRAEFNQEGSFYFHDHFNPKINILVVVYTPGKEYKL
jgi:plastocyanin